MPDGHCARCCKEASLAASIKRLLRLLTQILQYNLLLTVRRIPNPSKTAGLTGQIVRYRNRHIVC
jgi:hypothetical protein